VRLLFRPETVYLSDVPPPEGSGIHTLGEATVSDEIFGGSQQHVRLEMQAFEGVRSLQPAPPYGRRVFHIEAVQTSDRAAAQTRPRPGDRVWVGLRRYHVLDPSGLKILISCAETPAGEAAAAVGALLAQATAGPTTLLAVGEGERLAETRRLLEERLRRWPGGPSPRVTAKVRQGDVAAEMLAEAHEGDYELVVMGRAKDALGPVAQRILEQTETPVLLVQDARPHLARILVCTAVGEPGKTDVRFGGRIARRARAGVTVLHVARPDAEPWERERTEEHLAGAQAVLEALGVAVRTKIQPQAVFGLVATIIDEAEAGDYDLIVLGAPAWQHPGRLRWTDFASQIVRNTARPVLIVPMLA